MNDTPTVFVIDDDPAVRVGLSRLLRVADLHVVEFADAQAFLQSGRYVEAGCLVLDVEMPGLSGVELQRELAELHCALPIIFLTGHGDIGMCARAIKFGATDFLTKPINGDELLAAVRAALETDRAQRASRTAMDEIQQRLATLTPREREVLPLVVAGQMNKQVAARLGAAEKTIKVHRARVMQKLQVRTLAELVLLADRAGIGDPPG